MHGSLLATTKNYIDFHFTDILGHCEFYKSRMWFNSNTIVDVFLTYILFSS